VDGSVLQKIIENPRLPSLPTTAMQIIALCRRADVSGGDIAAVITRDPALSLKVLKTVNSGYYGLSHRIATIRHALGLLGLDTVKTLALGFSLVHVLRDLEGEAYDPTPIWRRSLLAAVCARDVAARRSLADPEEAFLAALLQDLGVLALIQALGAGYVALLKRAGDGLVDLYQLEQRYLPFDHTQVGEALALRWNLPPNLAAPIRHHEEPPTDVPGAPPSVYAVAVGNRAALACLCRESRAALDAYFAATRDWLGMEPEAARDLLEQGIAAGSEMADLFDLPADGSFDANDLLAEANDVMLELSLRSQQDASRLRREAVQLEARACRDALTGVFNRGHFDEFLLHEFRRAAETEGALSLILLDIDWFKRINDEHGHQAGDRVLSGLARLLLQAAPSDSLVARYGGEEFAIVLPGRGWRAATDLAEEVRAKLQRTPFPLEDGRQLSVTASFGAAGYARVPRGRTPESLIDAADRALYAAKAQGRDRVCADRETLTRADGESGAAAA